MLVSILPYMSVAQFVGTRKSKSALMLFDRHADMKYRYGSWNFWCRGYYVDTVGKNAKIITAHKKPTGRGLYQRPNIYEGVC